MSLWTDNSKLKTELTSYINTVTDKKSRDYIPVENSYMHNITIKDFYKEKRIPKSN